MNGAEMVLGEFFEILGLGDVLPDESVGVLIEAPFARAVGVSEGHRGAELYCVTADFVGRSPLRFVVA